ncbi:calcium-binding protein [Octadecabacter sp. 1_MG-2023]|uniref:calcium-binding protein n=1 Tax=unclassified Octadecabacter TaxID=196158 RepID=UPI001C08A192|nr:MULTISPECIES: calcium-binding protein [unclassified Octadecabacter]MBU2993390.1 hypothetical protein [Octadecabacter sp. B2R22]MDO6733154.1 calcium-binding protein [Octadecabacter sp. 1_MG-2023]
MTTYFITTDVTSQYSTLELSDQLLITEDGSIVNQGGFGVYADEMVYDLSISVFGDIYARNSGILLGGTVGGSFETTFQASNTVLIGEDATVATGNDFDTAIHLWGLGNLLTNHGNIYATVQGVTFSGSGSTVVNTGLISSVEDAAVEFGSQTDAGQFSNEITNSGMITGERGIVASSNYGSYIDNSGQIVGQDGYAIYLIASASSTEEVVIDNSGQIRGTSGAIYNAGDATTVSNSGELHGTVYLSVLDDTVRNTGSIFGTVILNSGDDTFIQNTGIQEGDVYGGAGNDTIIVRGGGVDGVIYGGSDDDTFVARVAGVEVDGGSGYDEIYASADVTALDGVEYIRLMGASDAAATGDTGDNTIIGSLGRNVIEGLEGEDLILGNGGNDEIYAGADDDRVRGGEGSDVINGGAGNDVLLSDGGDDALFGDAGNDIMRGGSGDDYLTGGEGADVMDGGTGADVFVFDDMSEVGINTTTADRIKGFTAGEDRIDVSAIEFSFRGTSAFTSSGDAEIRYFVNASGHAVINLDDNGDGSTDGYILALNTSALTADDFLL